MARLFKYFLIIFITIGLFQTGFALSSKNTKNFGSKKILTTSTPPITCNSQYGVMWVTPSGGTKTPGPFIIESTDKNVKSGAQILGKYETNMDYSTCYIQAGPYRINVPVYKIQSKKFNVSK